ncbi:MAG: hypothetical protein MUF77_11160 [Leptospira sp.]|nr:hypothetical protein [Leptospira sp.]
MRSSKFLFLSLTFTIILFSCTVTTPNFQFCDNFDRKLNCTEPRTSNDQIYLDRSQFKKMNPTWEDFSNFLYFTARETPGFIIQFDHRISGMEKEEIKREYQAKLTWLSTTERMEGFSLGDSSLASFHYLGALMKEEFRNQKIDKLPMNLESLGKLSLVYEYKIPGKPVESKERLIQLHWK